MLLQFGECSLRSCAILNSQCRHIILLLQQFQGLIVSCRSVWCKCASRANSHITQRLPKDILKKTVLCFWHSDHILSCFLMIYFRIRSRWLWTAGETNSITVMAYNCHDNIRITNWDLKKTVFFYSLLPHFNEIAFMWKLEWISW